MLPPGVLIVREIDVLLLERGDQGRLRECSREEP